ncbi:NAD(P)H-dependent glycerol-3-phosphate dehydrogenase [Candidatus Omnitrophota bacterium]
MDKLKKARLPKIKHGGQVAVIGDGGWGTTLAILLREQGYRVCVWGPFAEYLKTLEQTRENHKFLPGVEIPAGIIFSTDILQAVAEAEIVVLAVPSHFLRSVLNSLKGAELGNCLVVSAVKGIENETLLRMSELIEEVLGKLKLAVLSGPTISYEVARGLPTTCVAASQDIRWAKLAQNVFMHQRFRVYTSTDVVGVELGGALKNVIAIACGICDGLGFGANTKAAILTRGLVEIARLGQALGAKQQTFAGLSGLGDLVTTCISTHGRNLRVGEQIGRGQRLEQVLETMEMVAEGVRTCKSAFMLAQQKKIETPIITQVNAVLYQNKDPKMAVNELMLREKKPE